MNEKNIILITVDALRADHLGCMGYERETSPALDSFAANNILFTQAITQANLTRPSFQSILTSTYPLMYGGYERLKKERTPISEVFKNNGYKTAAFHSNPWLSSFFGYDRGFDTFVDSLNKRSTKRIKAGIGEKIKEQSEWFYSLLKKIFSVKHKITNKINPSKEIHYKPAEETTREVFKWIEKNNENNFFLWVHYMDAHLPHYPIDETRDFYRQPIDDEKILSIQEKSRNPSKLTDNELNLLIDLYDGEIRYVDRRLKLFFKKLKDLNLFDESLIIITADHGEPFYKRKSENSTNLYDENIHVPLIIRTNGKESKDIEQQVELLDIPTTILDYLDIEKPKSYLGKSLIPLIEGNSKEGKKYAMSEVIKGMEKGEDTSKGGNVQISCRTKGWKCIFEEENKRVKLYNLLDDPNETQNMSEQNQDITLELLNKIENHRKKEKSPKKKEKHRIKEKVNDLGKHL